MGDETHVLGEEFDDRLRDVLWQVLASLGAKQQHKSWALGGSQVIETWKVEIEGALLVIEAETYMGLSITGPAVLVGRIRDLVNQRMCERMAELERSLRALLVGAPNATVLAKNGGGRLEVRRELASCTRYVEIAEVPADWPGAVWDFSLLLGAYGNADLALDVDGRSGGSAEKVVELVRAWLVECVPWNALSRE